MALIAGVLGQYIFIYIYVRIAVTLGGAHRRVARSVYVYIYIHILWMALIAGVLGQYIYQGCGMKQQLARTKKKFEIRPDLGR